MSDEGFRSHSLLITHHSSLITEEGVTTVTAWRDEALEETLLGSITLDAPWALVERFSTLVRESGSREEELAVAEITARLEEWGIDYELHRPTCLISLPRQSS